MRAAIVGGIIAIITLAAYGIVQAGRWAPAALQARVETPAQSLSGHAPHNGLSAVDAAFAVATRWTLVRARDSWWARDKDAKALPLVGQNHWKAMALTGGHPSDLAGEWDGHGLRALGVFVAGEYWSL